MDNYLMLDGKKYELSPELANALLSCVEPEPEKKSPFEREEDEIYFYIGSNGFVWQSVEKSFPEDKEKYAVANYCTDKSLMEQRAMHETLNRLLWRYSEEHPEPDTSPLLYIICFQHSSSSLETFAVNPECSECGSIRFRSRSTAEAAIEEIVKPFLAAHPDFVW